MRLSIHAVLHEGALADGWHEAGIALGHSCAVMELARSFRIDRLVNATVELHQVAEDLCSSQVLLTVRPQILIDYFLTLIDQSLSHTQKLIASHAVVSILYIARLVLDASQLEQVHSVRWHS